MDCLTVKAAAAGRYHDIAVAVGIPADHLDGRHHECPRCGGTDRFRAFDDFAETGGVICNQCHANGNSDILATVQWMLGTTFPDAIKYVADAVGFVNGNGNGHSYEPDIMERIARAKRMPIESMRAYGAEAAKRGKLDVVRLPAYNQDGVAHSHFDLTESGKGWFRKGKGSSGIFLPLNGPPQPNERWLVVEGPKDACALHGLGFRACGTPGDNLPQKYVGLFRHCDVVIIPDRTSDAENKAIGSAGRLYGVASSVRIAKLPLEIATKSGDPNDVRDVLKNRDGEQLLRAAIDQAAEWHPDATPSEIPDLSLAEGQTDISNAKRLIELHGTVLRFVGPWDRWLWYDGRRWRLDEMRHVQCLAKHVAEKLFDRAARGTTSDGMKWATKSANMAGINSMVAASRGELAIHHDELNRYGFRLNVQNGTIDLRTGELHAHCKDDLLTQLSPVTFNPRAECPLWSRFLREITGENFELIGFLRRLVGYSMTGAIREHILPILYGTGANGKSVFLSTIQSLLGSDYATQAPVGMLMVKKNESHPTELADLFGRRLVATVETESGGQISETLVKQITGGDRIRARRMREDFWEFEPSHKVWMATNHKPDVRGTDHGIWRRLRLVPFTVTIPDHEQDHRLPERLRGELSGILNWALAGCLEWQADGLREPEDVLAATMAYRTEADYIGQFIDDECLVGAGMSVGATELFRAFQSWGGKMSQTKFGREIIAREFHKDRFTSGRKCYHGIGLRDVIHG